MFGRNRLWTVAAATLAAAGMLTAQTSGAPGRPARGARLRQFVASYLDLTEAQKTQIKPILDAARAAAAPLVAQLREGRAALHEAVKAGRPDAELDALAQKQGALLGQLAAIRAKAWAKVYPLLTPEQQDKLDHPRRLPLSGAPRVW
jgi:Spy/CpxP family protein refolding chaperone